MSPEEVRATRSAIDAQVPDAVVEVSGGLRLDTVRAFAEAGADRLSVGALTHSAPALDLSLLVEGT
jgi:nicotinate-nucleotide pyrophosphorylase (carboxylating)